MGIYYPALSVNLILRFDEALLTGETPSPQSADGLAETKDNPIGGPVKYAGPLSGTANRLSKTLAIIPRQASVELPGYRQAGKFSLSFAWRDLPIDPRALRAIGVEIFIGTVPASDFSRGMLGQSDDGRLASFLAQNDNNLMLAGVVDNHTITFSEKGSELKLDGRDLRAIYLDMKLSPQSLKDLNVNQPIDKVVTAVLAKAPRGSDIPAHTEASEWPNGVVPAPAAKEIITRVNLGAKGQNPQAATKGQADSLSFWDVITSLCTLVGGVPYFRGHELWIRPARSLYDQINAGQANGPSAATPFKDGKPRTVATGNSDEQISFRKMVYGRNIAALNFERKLQGTKVPTIQVVSIDPDQKGKNKLLEVEWPDTQDGADAQRVARAKVTSVDPSGNESSQEKMRISVPGVKDKSRLREIAKQIYEEIGRGEMGGSCSSKDLASLGGNNDDADILRIRPGDAVEFLVDSVGTAGIPPVVTELNMQAQQSAQEAINKLAERLGGNKDLAAVMVGTSRGQFQNLQTIFRVANVKYGWDANSGLGVDFDFQNYIETRYDVTPTASKKLQPKTPTIAKPPNKQAQQLASDFKKFLDEQEEQARKNPTNISSKRYL